jgi:hypothetical protein
MDRAKGFPNHCVECCVEYGKQLFIKVRRIDNKNEDVSTQAILAVWFPARCRKRFDRAVAACIRPNRGIETVAREKQRRDHIPVE